MLDSNNRYFDIGAFTGTGVLDADAFNYNRDTRIPEAIPGQRYYALYSFSYRGKLITKALKSRTYNSRELAYLSGAQCAVYHDESDLVNCVCKKVPPDFQDTITPKNEPVPKDLNNVPSPEQVAKVEYEPTPMVPSPHDTIPVAPPMPEPPAPEALLASMPRKPKPVREPEPEPMQAPDEEIEIPTEPAPPKKRKKLKRKKTVEVQYARGFFAEIKNGLFPLFKGRACRREFAVVSSMFLLINAIIMLLALIPVMPYQVVFALVGTVSLLATIANISMAGKRFRDMGKTPWLAGLCLIPPVAGFVNLACLCIKGEDDENAYGPDHRQFYSNSGVFKVVITVVLSIAIITISTIFGVISSLQKAGLDIPNIINLGHRFDTSSDYEDEDFDDSYDWEDTSSEEYSSDDYFVTEEPEETPDLDTSQYTDSETGEPLEDWQNPDSDATSSEWDWQCDNTDTFDDTTFTESGEFVEEAEPLDDVDYSDTNFLEGAEEDAVNDAAEENNVDIQSEETPSLE